jgi:uncharacterized protein YmfQ (DUF2313 family)
MRRDAISYAAELAALLPQGFAWTREPDSNLMRLLAAMADGLAEAEGLLWDVTDEADPRTATRMLPDWERLLGLPDDCLSRPGSTLQERRLAAATKLTATGGQSRAYFIGLARTLLNQAVAIEEFRPFRAGRSRAGAALTNDPWTFAWRVRAPGYPAPIRFRAGQSRTGDSLRRDRQTPLECLFRRLRPAHTIVLFAYGSEA